MDFAEDVWPLLVCIFEIVKAILLWPFPARRKSLNGEVALITGAGSGLGAGLAEKLAQKGCTVVCWDLNENGNEKTVKKIRESGGEAFGFKVDVTNRAEVYEVARKAENVAGNITILVNNAGIVGGKSFIDSKDEVIQKTFEVNSISHFWTAKAFLPSMIENDHGHIVSIASSAGYFGVPKLADYCASKAAAAHFADSLQTELYKSGSDVNVTWICPYAISTGMFEGFSAKRPWLVDILTPKCVVDEIVTAIETNATFVLLPKILHFIHFLNACLPRTVALRISKWGGVMDAMNTFTGRTNQKKRN